MKLEDVFYTEVFEKGQYIKVPQDFSNLTDEEKAQLEALYLTEEQSNGS